MFRHVVLPFYGTSKEWDVPARLGLPKATSLVGRLVEAMEPAEAGERGGLWPKRWRAASEATHGWAKMIKSFDVTFTCERSEVDELDTEARDWLNVQDFAKSRDDREKGDDGEFVFVPQACPSPNVNFEAGETVKYLSALSRLFPPQDTDFKRVNLVDAVDQHDCSDGNTGWELSMTARRVLRAAEVAKTEKWVVGEEAIDDASVVHHRNLPTHPIELALTVRRVG
ncbi:hypothetical protein DFJ73DRAFT_763338 [Zopfochytrium polystomum]|nr:hypothetical protein DFJ73DRAFT_763338 [Zopfochytrium polystomum]